MKTCLHLGTQLRTEQCPTCKGSVALKVYQCEQFGECTIAKPLHGRPTCKSCDRYCPIANSEDRYLRTGFARQFHAASQSIPPLPDWPRDRGIVIVAGGWRFFPSLYVTVKLIRATGCNLPIQVWHLAGEFHELMGWLLRDEDVEWVNADDFMAANPEWRLQEPDINNRGWATKALAATACPFRQVILFDADCYPIKDPACIFETAEFEHSGAVFFPDLAAPHSAMAPRKWLEFGMEPREEREWESGQFAVDKARQWSAMWLSFWLNSHSRWSYRFVYGDKDTFHVAFRKLDAPVAMHPDAPEWRNVAFLQRLPSGEEFTVHRCRDKFRLEDPNSFRTPQKFARPIFDRRLPREKEAHNYFAELRRLYTRPSLLIVGHPRGLTSFAADVASKACDLLPHPARACEIFNRDCNPNWSEREYAGTNQDVYLKVERAFHHWQRATVLKDISQPQLVAQFVTENKGVFRVLYVHRSPEQVRLFQEACGWHRLPHPSEHVELFRSIADAEVNYDQLVEDPKHLWQALEALGYSVDPFDYRDERFVEKREETRKRWKRMEFEARVSKARIDGDVSRRGEYTVMRRWFDKNAASAEVVVDIGAHAKKFSNSWNLIADHGWRGVLVEPEPNKASLLDEEFKGDFAVVQNAVSDFRGRRPLYLSRDPGQHSLLSNWEAKKRSGQIDVDVVTLPDVLQKHRVPKRFGVLSVDTEGTDERVVRPMLEQTDWRPDFLIVEWRMWGAERLPWADLLEAAGYVLHGVFKDNWLWTFNKAKSPEAQ